MAKFATVEDLATHLQRSFSAEETATADQALEGASDMIRGYTQQTLDLVNNDTIALRGLGTYLLWLPQLPVVAVDSITVDGVALAAADYRLTASTGRLERVEDPWPAIFADDPFVTVQYDHGYATIPHDIKLVCLEVASRMFTNPADVGQITLGSFSEQYGAGGMTRSVGLSLQDKAVLDQYAYLNVS